MLTTNKWQLYTDASGYAAGAHMVENGKSWIDDRFFEFDEKIAALPIHCKEMYAIEEALFSYEGDLKNQHVTVLCDNQAVVQAFYNIGGRDLRLSRALKRIIQFTTNRNIALKVDWVPTDEQKADRISRETPISESALRPNLKRVINDVFAPTLDLFATHTNRLTSTIKYYSRFPEKEATGTNGLTIEKSTEEILYVFPPKPIRRKALNVTRQAKKALYIFTFNGENSTELHAFIQVKNIKTIIKFQIDISTKTKIT